MKRLLWRSVAAAAMVLAFIGQETWALAGTTGGLSGVVTDDRGAGVAGAIVKVASSSENASATTDASGHFAFISLVPDTYTVSVEKSGYTAGSLPGVSVFADQTETINPRLSKLSTIAKVTSRSAGALVKGGTTADVYSINAAQASKVTGIGGGGSLDQAYSAIATMPGAYVPVGQIGWFQNVYIRGGDYDQVGYELDGVPVNRSFDNYPSSTASSLGQQELQVYTGAAPSNAEGQGLSGFINQVIRTGTNPGFISSDLGVGGPTFYHKANIEAGGATPNRTFSYYIGLGGSNQDQRSVDNWNGAGYSSLWGYLTGVSCGNAAFTAANAPASCFNNGAFQGGNTASPWYALAPFEFYSNYSDSRITSRDNVANFHFAIPHKNGDGRDDLQLLWQGSDLQTQQYSSPNDYGCPGTIGGFNYPFSNVYTGSLNQLVAPGAVGSLASAIPYCMPSAPAAIGCGGAIPAGNRDAADNAIGMVKIQYQKNFSSQAYLRVYGYSVYTDWFNNGPVSASLCCAGIPVDYEVYTHTRGLSGTFADQLSSKNLLQLQGSLTDASSTRVNNGTMFAGAGTEMGVLVNGNNPNSGICYTAAGAAANCDSGAAGFTVQQLGCMQNPALNTPGGCGGVAPIASVTAPSCGGGPCTWDIVDNGYNGRYNTVQPNFWS